jgi:hypothetical protein
MVLCCDEKSQCEALERTQPGLLLGPGHIRKRPSIKTTLFAGLKLFGWQDPLTRRNPPHSHEWLGFPKQPGRDTPRDLDLHLIVDNVNKCATHKQADVKAWLTPRPFWLVRAAYRGVRLTLPRRKRRLTPDTPLHLDPATNWGLVPVLAGDPVAWLEGEELTRLSAILENGP